MRNLFSFFSIVLLGAALGGCSSVKAIETQAYLQDKPRVDQNREYGNSGYLSGTKPEDTTQYKETRKIFVLEMTKKPIVDETEVTVEEKLSTSSGTDTADEMTEVSRETTETTNTYTTADIDNEEFYKDESHQKEATSFQEYTIQKDDTLQKISKKFYDSYSKWPGIYDLNRDVISDPDNLKPGVTIRIPTN